MAGPAWAERLEAELAELAADAPGRIGVHVRDLASSAVAQYRAERPWYLASMVKVPVAIAVLRDIDAGRYTLDTPLTVRASDYVDGAGPAKHLAVGASVPVRWLIEQMLVYSDNTASDMLIGLAGVDHVNAVTESLVPDGFGPITPLGDVRRRVYAEVAPAASRLAGRELLALHQQPSDAAKLQLLARQLGLPPGAVRQADLDKAYDRYYASGLNSGRLDRYGDLLEAVVEGRALSPAHTTYLLDVMGRAATGTHRIAAGLPRGTQFAHKTGTQRRRVCDAGLVTAAGRTEPRRVLVVACVRDAPTLEAAERTLRAVGAALCRSGLITQGAIDASACPAAPVPERRAAPGAAVRFP